MASKTVNAKWVGAYVAELADGTELVPGETVVELPADEASDSDNWQPVGGSTPKKSGSDD